MDLRILRLLVYSDDVVQKLFRFAVFVVRAFHEDISLTSRLDFLLSHLDLGTAIKLKLPDGVSAFSDDQPNDIVRHGNDIGSSRRRAVRRHHGVVHRLVVDANLLTNVLQSLTLVFPRLALLRICQLSGNRKLFFTNFVSCTFIGLQDSVDDGRGLLHIFLSLTNDQHVLVIFVVRLSGGSLLLGAFASDQDFALRFFLETFLVVTLRSY